MEEELKRLISEGKVIPFVGAGVSKEAKDSNGNNIFPEWKDLLKLLADGLEDNDKQIIEGMLNRPSINYLEVADFIKKYYTTNVGYTDKLKEIFDIKRELIKDSSLDLAKSIWGLEQNLIITTNYDKIMHWASKNPDNTKRWDIENISNQGQFLHKDITEKTVWYIHGHIENLHNIILTTDEYERFYGKDSEFKVAFETLKITLATKSFLFIGFSLNDEYFINELEKIANIFSSYSAVHYVLLKKGKNLPQKFEKRVLPIYFDDYGQPLINKIKFLAPNIPKIHLEKIKELIKKLGGDEEEFLSAYFGEEYREILGNEETYKNLTLKLQTPNNSLDTLLKEKKELEEKIASYSLNSTTQSQIDRAFKALEFEKAREILDEFLSSTEQIQEDIYKAHYQKALSYKEQIKYQEAKEEMEFIPYNKIKYVILLNDYAHIYELCGEYDNALPLYIKSMKILEDILGENHLNTATSYNNLAELYRLMGKYEEAKPLYRKAQKIQIESLGENHPDTATSYNNLALLYRSMKEYEKAEPLYQKALKIREESLRENHPDTATSYNNLAELYKSMEEYEEAEPLYLKALKIREGSLGENHPDTAVSYGNLAGLYRSMGEYEEAKPLYLKAQKIQKDRLGENHPDTAVSYGNLGTFYYYTKDYQESYNFMTKAIEIWQRFLPNHPDLIASKESLKVIEQKLNGKDEATEAF